VMGCVVNGIKEAKQSNIGISLPGRMGNESVPMLFIDGESKGPLAGEAPGKLFTQHIQEYVEATFSPRDQPKTPLNT
ncbi:4-hydroxy-3-methylbut-2-en-1-yl diphosphate synthase, partial [Candidatus Bipolaricaulota bacterium]|nr:4-hydroxy-3-methylbut-2-en-1-yl diphosphate synthase [Candidatus Bipolaricaulota bacterium]